MAIVRSSVRPIVAVGLLAAMWCASVGAADPKPSKDKSGASAAEDKDSTKDDAKAKAKDRYRVPDGDVKELLAFIKDIRGFRPSPQEARQHSLKAMAVIKAAAEQIQQIATPEDKKLEGYREAMDFLLLVRAQKTATASEEEQTKLLADIVTAIKDSPTPSQFLLSGAMQFATGLEFLEPPQTERAATAYNEIGSPLAKSEDQQVARIGAKMEGAARRLGLLGNTMDIVGTRMDGDKFDWAKYRGKVVLVDFWATWCPPCRAELPNVKKNYELYHDRGFDVVGISLDHGRAPLEKFLADEKIPWTTLYDNAEGETPSADYYGVMGIPTVILVDKEGKVVSTMARGPELSAQLEKLLGPPEPEKKEKSEASSN